MDLRKFINSKEAQGWDIVTSKRFEVSSSFSSGSFFKTAVYPFTDVLSRETVDQALDTIEFAWNERIYTPLVTLWVFLGQVLSADHSCRNAVARLDCSPCVAWIERMFLKNRRVLPSTESGYQNSFSPPLHRLVARKVEDQADKQWLWKGRHVYMFDGTTTLMPDTAKANRTPILTGVQPARRRRAFPLARVGALFSLCLWRTILDLRIAKYAGKGQGEVTLLHRNVRVCFRWATCCLPML